MTNEERQRAIEWLKGRPVMMAGAKKMYDLAVEALEAYVPDMNVGETEPSRESDTEITRCTDDTISRQAAQHKINALIDEFETIMKDIRERHVDDSVCGLCEYDGAYMGQSGDWCNECPGFERDDCFKLKEQYREEWAGAIKNLPTVQQTITHEQAIDYLHETGWLQNHDRILTESKIVPPVQPNKTVELDDCISRQDAVELAMEYCPDDDGSVQKDGDLRELLDELENLPPVQPDEKLEKCRFEYINACRTVTFPTPDTTKKDISDAYAVIKVLQPIFGDVTF